MPWQCTQPECTCTSSAVLNITQIKMKDGSTREMQGRTDATGFFFLFFSWDRISLYSPGWLQSCDFHASVSWELTLQVYVPVPGGITFFLLFIKWCLHAGYYTHHFTYINSFRIHSSPRGMPCYQPHFRDEETVWERLRGSPLILSEVILYDLKATKYTVWIWIQTTGFHIFVQKYQQEWLFNIPEITETLSPGKGDWRD
jgi:hypothetical protein